MVVETVELAANKVKSNRHELEEILDTSTIAEGVFARCKLCGATLRYYKGKYMGEVYSTICREAPAPASQIWSNEELRELRLEQYETATLNVWRNIIHEYAVEKGWWDAEYTSSRNFGDLIALLHTEASEAYEEWRNGRLPNEVYYDGLKPEGIPMELIDLLIRVLDMCGHYNIDVEKCFIEKHEYNLTRPYRHGGKRS